MAASRAWRVGRVEQRLEVERVAATRASEVARRLKREAPLAAHVLEANVAVRADADHRRTVVPAERAGRRRRRLVRRQRRGRPVRTASVRRRRRGRSSAVRAQRRRRASAGHVDAMTARAGDARARKRGRQRRLARGAPQPCAARVVVHDERRRRMLRTSGAKPPTVTAAKMLRTKSAMSHQPLTSPFELRQKTV